MCSIVFDLLGEGVSFGVRSVGPLSCFLPASWSFSLSHYSTMQLEAAGWRRCFAGRGFACMVHCRAKQVGVSRSIVVVVLVGSSIEDYWHVRRGAPFDTCFARSAFTCIVTR